MKDEACAAIDNAADQAIAIIEQLPAASRPAAANGFNTGFNIVLGFFKNIGETLKHVMQAVVDFVKGIWNKLVQAYNTVRGWAQTAWNAIQGLFSRGAYPSDPGHGKTGLDRSKGDMDEELDAIRHEVMKLLERINNLPRMCGSTHALE
ncbi:uncharacterized protein BDW43DRAFT_317584 [Aspergillus alliaceus]|uniref:uncharacterized protein n=1 Tax=Petromyces alliaceus TaxID=209559 RepID=UPI0012A631EC|nr:uncharacterized protein BDW43DRAFT_317584 [Aspergillus alliaceus]KAB8226784.1 hypothetical protein BDW43DRAFT_317584 [Aspergillus alliaceus]